MASTQLSRTFSPKALETLAFRQDGHLGKIVADRAKWLHGHLTDSMPWGKCPRALSGQIAECPFVRHHPAIRPEMARNSVVRRKNP
jgi:hypothetical protein